MEKISGKNISCDADRYFHLENHSCHEFLADNSEKRTEYTDPCLINQLETACKSGNEGNLANVR